MPFCDLSQPAAGYPLLDGLDHATVFEASKDVGVYHHHPRLAYHDGVFYGAWSNHSHGEDGPGQRTIGASSVDGLAWSNWQEFQPPMDVRRPSEETGRVVTPIAWVGVDGVMHIVSEVNDNIGFENEDGSVRRDVRDDVAFMRARRGHGRIARAISPSGDPGESFWLVDDPPEPIEGFPAYRPADDPAIAPVANAINAVLRQPVHAGQWEFRDGSVYPTAADGHKQCEPTCYRRADGATIRLTRDKRYSHRMYASISRDNGATWTDPTPTGIPDSPSKSYAHNLADGRVFLLGNFVSEPFETARHGHYKRDPLVLALSDDGVTFDRAWAVRSGLEPHRLGGKGKGKGWQYPHAIVAQGALWIIYSIGKEDIAVTRVPLSLLD